MGFFLISILLIWLIVLAWALWQHRQSQYSQNPHSHFFYRDLLAGGGLVALTLAFFWRTVSGDVYQPADGGDLVSFLFPTYRFAAAEIVRGALPLWNPTLYAGAPFISDIQAGFLYLPNLLLFWLNPHFDYRTMQWLVLGHVAWAGLGMYTLLRTLRWPTTPLTRPAAFFGALAFMFCDPILIHLGNLNLIAVLSWLPWILAAYTLALQPTTRKAIWLIVAALLFALANYAGHAQSTLYLALTLGVYTLGWILQQWHEAGWRALFSGGWRLLFVGIFALLLSAPILLPSLELTAYTERSDLSYQETTSFSLAPTQLIGILTPGFFGRGPALHWSLWDRVETPYAGVATFLLACGALLMATADLRRRLWTWLLLALVGLLAALGVYAIVHGWLTLLIPPLAQLRAPARTLILWNTGLAVMAAVGVDLLVRYGLEIVTSEGGVRWRKLLRQGTQAFFIVILPLGYFTLFLTQDNETAFLRASIALLALLFAGIWWLATWVTVEGIRLRWWSGFFASILLSALLFLDLTSAGAYTDISPVDPTSGFQQSEIVNFLQSDAQQNNVGLFRIDTNTDIQDLWQPDTAALYGLEDVGGIVNPLALQQWSAQWEATRGRGTRAYDLLNVKYVIVRDGTPLPDGKFELAYDAEGALSVYRNTTPLSRAWVVHQANLASNVEDALAQIQSPNFDPLTTVILLDNDEWQTATPFGPLGDALPANASQATITRPNASTLEIAVNAAAPGNVVLSELWYPGWQATVIQEGQRTTVPVLHANGSLRAIPVPMGESTIQMRFQPNSWRWGKILAGFAILALAILLGSVQRHHQRMRV